MSHSRSSRRFSSRLAWSFFLLQGPALPLQAQLGVVGLAGGPVILRPGLVQGPLGLEAGLPLGGQGLAGLFQGGNFPPRVAISSGRLWFSAVQR